MSVFNAVQWRKAAEVPGRLELGWAQQGTPQEQEAQGDFQRSLSSCLVEGGLHGIWLPNHLEMIFLGCSFLVLCCHSHACPDHRILRAGVRSVSDSLLRARRPSQGRHTAGAQQKPAE